MRSLWSRRPQHDYLNDALALLTGWSREGRQLQRILIVDDAQHAALTERIKVVADALHQRPEVRRMDGHTQIKVRCGDSGNLTQSEVALAARIEDAYRAVMGTH